MSVLEPMAVTLVDGATVTLRSPEVDEAQRVVDYIGAICHETDQLMRDPADEVPTVEFERRWLGRAREDAGRIMIMAEADGRIVGLANATQGVRVRQRHLADLGISTRSGWRGRGLGRAMMEHVIGWARANAEIEWLALSVFADNDPALALYRRLGFVEDAVLPRRAKRDGVYLDLVEMSLWVGPEPAPAPLR